MRRTAIAPTVLAMLLGSACVYFDQPLELEIVNESENDVRITIRDEDGVEGESHTIAGAGRQSISTDRPPLWSVWVNDQRATSYEVWHNDNPTIDLTIYVRTDGTVDVVDE